MNPPCKATRTLPLGLVATALLLACPPDRRTGDDDDGLPGTELQGALFTLLDYEDDAQSATLVLVDSSHSCDALSFYGSLETWNLESGVGWVEVDLTLGDEVGDWATEFMSQAAWDDACTGTDCWDYAAAAIFSGSAGVGPYGDDDDDTVDDDDSGPPPPTEGREVTGYPGWEPDDVLVITSYGRSTVAGYIDSTAGDYAFHATHCGEGQGDDDDSFDGNNNTGVDGSGSPGG